ncbi:dUTP diphosphatase [Fructobacillus ficulneus]|uniref:dUTP diphosphatase n=1 Tax=Fructobacillus ficulneus TaxID=157463 RepID=A0A0K8MGU4_9LACO|nr:dUTP diphosphatase [Fructobacillus ficulneus]GAO99413.1 deoxyuridine 5'-triphosphate nucleotidohydrolase [Fructobacillus ficulneus]
MKIRGFEIVSKYVEAGLTLPARSTEQAAGYDFAAAVDITIPAKSANNQKPVLVPTGIKAYMQANEYLQLVSRSSLPKKKHLVMPNAVGIIDADYYNNEQNEGEIMVQVLNLSDEEVVIAKGDRIAQGIFLPYLLADQDADSIKAVRAGGFGSTGEG